MAGARLRLETLPEISERHTMATVQCSHGGARWFLLNDEIRLAKFDIVALTTERLEHNLHTMTGCGCRVPREGEMAR